MDRRPRVRLQAKDPMLSRLPTASLTVSDLLNGATRLAIPTYQRAYSWTREEAGQLLDDLLAATGVADSAVAETDYFLGTVLLLDRSGLARWPGGASDSELRTLDVVDGQQRLITLAILASVLRDLEVAAENELWSRLDALVALPGTGRTGQSRRLFRLELKGKDQLFIERYVLTPGASVEMPASESEEGAGASTILEVREHFLAQLGSMTSDERQTLARFICDHTHMVAILTGEIDRAHRFFMVLNDRGRPLLRSDILKAEVLHALPAGAAPRVLEAWDEASRSLGDGFDRFFGHLRSIHGISRPQVITAVRSIVESSGGAERFVLGTMAPLAAIYSGIQNAGEETADVFAPSITRRLVYLNRLNGEEWVPSAILALKRLEDGDVGAERLVAEIDRQAHLMRLQMLGGDRRTRRFNDIADAIRSGAALQPDAPVFRFSREELKSIAFNLGALWRRNPAFCKLLLLRVSDEIAGRLTYVEPSSLTIEHILPQNLSAASEWRRIFPDADQRAQLTQSLGNLVLIPQRLNEAARNLEFARKRELLARRDGATPTLALNTEVAAAARWGPDEILAREARIFSIVGELLRIEVKPAAALR